MVDNINLLLPMDTILRHPLQGVVVDILVKLPLIMGQRSRISVMGTNWNESTTNLQEACIYSYGALLAVGVANQNPSSMTKMANHQQL